MARLTDKVRIMKHQRRQLRLVALKAADKKAAKAHAAELAAESDFDDDIIKQTEELIAQRDQEALEKKRQKAKERGEAFDEEQAAAGKGKDKSYEGMSVEQLVAKIKQIDERIAKTKLEMTDRVRRRASFFGYMWIYMHACM